MSDVYPKRWLSILAMVVFASAVVDTQRETIPEAVARGSTGRIRTAPSGLAPAMTEILRDTDMVVRGTIGKPRSYLSEDQRDVYTDYPIMNFVILYQARVHASRVSGVAQSVTVTQLGGTILMNGVNFTQTEHGLGPLEPGAEGLFLLQRIDSRDRIAGMFFGAFSISGGVVHRLTKVESFAPEFQGAPAATVVAEIVASARALREKP
ncbi:MAG TPA: hypothetical protein VNJ02_16760 [Vicinamibacterales bacterium]|nr:hypothetical protein [Vicinamibacterales bacterium]